MRRSGAAVAIRMRRKRAKRRAAPGADRRRIETAAEFYLRARFREHSPVSTRDFADHLGVDRSHLTRRVKEYWGVPVGEFLRKRQLAEAIRLLTTTPLGVNRVWAASGFGTEWTFYRCFRAAFGVTPAEYRRRSQNVGRSRHGM